MFSYRALQNRTLERLANFLELIVTRIFTTEGAGLVLSVSKQCCCRTFNLTHNDKFLSNLSPMFRLLNLLHVAKNW